MYPNYFNILYVHCLYLCVFIEYSYSDILSKYEGYTALFQCSVPYLKLTQAYINDKRMIGIIPERQGQRETTYIMELEKFDNNTEIMCVEKNSYSSYRKTQINVTNDINCTKSEDFNIQKFSMNQPITFSCREFIEQTNGASHHFDIHVGLINMTSNKIDTFMTTMAERTFDLTYNGTMALCCIQYKVQVTDYDVTITRYVKKKTLLIYDTSEEALANMINSKQTNIYIITSVAIIMLVFFITLIIIYRKRWHKHNGLQTDTMNSRVLYADLDIQSQGNLSQPSRSHLEESPYACIIGELRPNSLKESRMVFKNDNLKDR